MKNTFDASIFILCCCAMMCLAITTNLPPVLFTTFSDAFGGAAGLSAEQLGRIPATVFASMVLAIILTGPLADTMGAKFFVLTGLCSIVFGLFLLSAARNFLMVLLGVGAMGFGAGNLEVVLSPIVAAANPNQRSSALNQLHLFYCVGAVVSVVIASIALHFMISWRTICFIIMLFPLFLLIPFSFIKTPPLISEHHPMIPLRRFIHTPYLLAGMIAISLAGAVEVGIAQWLPAYAELELGFSKSISGSTLAAFSIAMATGRFVLAKIMMRHGALQVMIVCCVVTVVLLLGTYILRVPALAILLCVSIGFSVSCLWPSTLAVTADYYPRGGATLFAVLSAVGNVGCIVMPWVIGYITEMTSLKMGILSTILAPLFLIVLYGWMYKMKTISHNHH